MTAIILQARLNSARLPEKSLYLIDEKPLVFRVMETLNQIPADIRILACPDDSLAKFSIHAMEAGFQIYAGPKNDVLRRYCQVIRKYSITRVIRATGDNPFVFTDAAADINSEAILQNADYSGYTGLPYGAGVESVSAAALLRALDKTSDPYDLEHVCPYLYNNPDKFIIRRMQAPQKWRYPDIRITIDTKEDMEQAVVLYDALKDKPDRFKGETIIKTYLEKFSHRARGGTDGTEEEIK